MKKNFAVCFACAVAIFSGASTAKADAYYSTGWNNHKNEDTGEWERFDWASVVPVEVSDADISKAMDVFRSTNGFKNIDKKIAELASLDSAALVALAKNPDAAVKLISAIDSENLSKVAQDLKSARSIEAYVKYAETFVSADQLNNYFEAGFGFGSMSYIDQYHLDDVAAKHLEDWASDPEYESLTGYPDISTDEEFEFVEEGGDVLIREEGSTSSDWATAEGGGTGAGVVDNTDQQAYEDYANSESGGSGGAGSGGSGTGSGSSGNQSKWKITGL